MNRLRFSPLMGCVAVLAVAAAPLASAADIDTFTTVQSVEDLAADGVAVSNTSGSRTLTADETSAANPALPNNRVAVDIGGGEFAHSQSTGVRGLSTTEWNQAFDLSSASAIVLNVSSSDHTGTVTITLTGGGTSSQTQTIGTGPQVVSFPLSGFVGGANLASLSQIRMSIDGTSAASEDWDLRLSSVAYTSAPVVTAPTGVPFLPPVALVLVAAGLAGIGVVRTRNRG